MPETELTYAPALELAAQGWAPFPCKWRGEHAKAPLTINGFHDASRNPDQIRAWWTRWPQAMIGAPVPESLLVIDLDPRHGGNLAELEKLTGPLPATLTVWSGRNDGGRHLYYLRPAGPLTSTRLPEGIDLRVGGKHYCIMPPSIHPTTGMPYLWEEHPAAAIPPKPRELLRPPPQPVHTFSGTGDGAGLIREVAEAQEGKRHDVLVWAAFRARGDGILDQIADELTAASVSTGYPETSARRTIASVRRAAS
jgi:Bifunctional DNA primase/polymerase, N-terminal